jgi:hypothetical protein
MTSTRIALSSLLLSLLAACGGGGGGGGVSSTVSSATTIAGTVIDGYIEGAVVCLDLNSNAACDANEPTMTTGSDGKYSINYAGTTTGLHVLSLVPSTAKDADDKGLTIAQAGKTAFTLMAPAPVAGATNTHVTPLTTLVSHQMTQSGITDAKVAETQVKEKFGITTALLNNDFKANASVANTNSAELALAITNAIAAAQSSLSTSAAFQTAAGTTDKVKVQAAAQQAAINLVAKTVAPTIVDKETGTLNKSLTPSTVIASTQTVAASSATKLAIESTAPKATSTTVQAFVDGVVIGTGEGKGDYIDASGKRINGNWTGFTNALQVNYIKGDIKTMTGTEKQLVLIGDKWLKQYQNGTNYWLTTNGWTIEDLNIPVVPAGDCVNTPITAFGPTEIACLTQFDYSGKKVSSLLTDPCTDNNGKPFPGCDVNTVFPANTYAYRLNLSYEQEAYKMNVSTTWNGYGDGMNPKQTTVEGWVKASLDPKTTHAIGDQCNTTLNIATYDQAAGTGTIKFSDMSDYAKDCSTVFSNLGKAKSTEIKSFKVSKVNGETVMVYQIPLIFKKNNPDDGRSQSGNGVFGSYNGKIFDGENFVRGASKQIGQDGKYKMGNKNILDTYLKMTGLPAYPY